MSKLYEKVENLTLKALMDHCQYYGIAIVFESDQFVLSKRLVVDNEYIRHKNKIFDKTYGYSEIYHYKDLDALIYVFMDEYHAFKVNVCKRKEDTECTNE